MNTRLLAPIIAFVLWSAICWRWYVCGIKERCDDAIAASPVAPGQAVPFAVEQYLQKNTVAAGEWPPDEDTPQLPQPPRNHANGTEQVSFSALPDQVFIHFPYNSIRKQDDAAVEEYLSQVAEYLKRTGHKVSIVGHTDNVGDPKSNYRLGLQRAQTIRKILVAKGVKAEYITCSSEGEKKPIASNDNPRGRYKNRRVELRIQP